METVTVGMTDLKVFLTRLTSVAVPVADPRTGHVSGALALVGAADLDVVLLLAMARHGAHDIEQRSADGGTPRQRLLNDTFRRHRRHTRGPLVLVDEETLLMNTVAAGTFDDGDRPVLWDMARQAVGSLAAEPLAFTTRGGTTLMGSVKPVYERGTMIAALVEFRAPGEPTARAARPSFGWDSLTPSERGLIRLIADGLTNREAAARLYVSHHTVDSHLRHIFRKLGIHSRVQLARIAAAMSVPPTASPHERAIGLGRCATTRREDHGTPSIATNAHVAQPVSGIGQRTTLDANSGRGQIVPDAVVARGHADPP